MPQFLTLLKKEIQPKVSALLDDINSRKDRDFFQPFGTQVYCGRQGTGKTISAVYHVMRLLKRYPNALLVSNLDFNADYFVPLRFETADSLVTKVQSIKDYDYSSGTVPIPYIKFDDAEQLSMALTHVNNDKFGVIYLIDEIHLYFNSLGSLNIPMYVFAEISQQRKQRKLIIGTSQLFMRLAKPFREQCDNIIICRTFFGVLTKQTAYDGAEIEQDYNGKLIGTKNKTGWFYQTTELRKIFDTYQKVVSGQEIYENNRPLELVQNRNIFARSK